MIVVVLKEKRFVFRSDYIRAYKESRVSAASHLSDGERGSGAKEREPGAKKTY